MPLFQGEDSSELKKHEEEGDKREVLDGDEIVVDEEDIKKLLGKVPPLNILIMNT
jgi:hypothetical protein